ncbi:hypothetical protein [Lentisalinibacter salinarum]|uniref:hypothetical protein n=1 Tax=Lentisalinibacter salinarum TaxID=2992239 RepID=UPI00387011FA
MYINPESVLRWIHILAMVYWLGGEWGVFQTSYNVANPKLSLDERRRHMETAYRIDILARTGIILLLPLGLHMGFNLGVHDYGGGWLWLVWILAFAWLSLTWSAFVYRDTDRGLRLTRIDEAVRYVVIPALFLAAVWSYLTDWPFRADWYSTKVLIYSLLLVIGLGLRFIMRHWVPIFRELAEKGPNPALEQRLASELAIGRGMAYVYWIGIASVAFLGATKPF